MACQRTKNIKPSGLCNVCDDVVNVTTSKLSKQNRKKDFPKKIEIDMKEMVKMHDKLRKGEIIEPSKVSSVFLTGIIKILVQHDALNNLDAKMIAMEEENKSY
jgi:hypothetical protein